MDIIKHCKIYITKVKCQNAYDKRGNMQKLPNCKHCKTDITKVKCQNGYDKGVKTGSYCGLFCVDIRYPWNDCVCVSCCHLADG